MKPEFTQQIGPDQRRYAPMLAMPTARLVKAVFQLCLCGCATQSASAPVGHSICRDAPDIAQLVQADSIDRADNSQLELETSNDHTRDEQRLQLVYSFPHSAPDQHFNLVFSFAPAGRYLDEESYQRQRREAQARGVDPERQFPRIGRRASQNILGFGPGGAAESLTFTTKDACFDMRIVQSQLLPNTLEAPAIDLRQVASAIEQRYEHLASARTGAFSSIPDSGPRP